MQEENTSMYKVTACEDITYNAITTYDATPCRSGMYTITITYVGTGNYATIGGLPHVMTSDANNEMLTAVMDLVLLIIPPCM